MNVTRSHRYLLIGSALLFWLVPMASADARQEIRIGVKVYFTEGQVLGEVLVQLAHHAGLTAVRRAGNGDEWDLLSGGEIDAYVEYTGTLTRARIREQNLSGEQELREYLERNHVRMTERLGFNNTYALGMKETLAQALDIQKISDLVAHPSLRYGFDVGFLNRDDGWFSLAEKYGLQSARIVVPEEYERQGGKLVVKGALLHEQIYARLNAGDLEVTDLYSTDAPIRTHDLRILKDDARHFPRYDAVILYRAELERTAPRFVELVRQLEGKLDDHKMALWNDRARNLIDQIGRGRTYEQEEVERAYRRRFRSIGPKIVASRLISQELGVDPPKVTVGSKKFTEGVILGEMVAHCARFAGAEAVHEKELGGTQILWNALLKGDIDVYVEYTGTLRQEILAQRQLPDGLGAIREELKSRGLLLSNPLGFNNTYALGMRRSHAEEKGIETISDLARFPNLRIGFSNEFLGRQDGWAGIKRRFGLPHQNVRGMDHDLAYKGIESGIIDITDLYSTDAEIRQYDLVTLTDDESYFPHYEAVILYRKDLAERAPQVVDAFLLTEDTISEPDMVEMNSAVKFSPEPGSEGSVAAAHLWQALAIEIPANGNDSRMTRLVKHTIEHLILVGTSLSAAIVVAFFLGIVAARSPLAGPAIMGAVGIVQTIPSLALLVFMVPFLGIGEVPAILALFVYSLLPIVENTYTGLKGISRDVRESAIALGLGSRARLWRIEIPMAARSILAGIRTSAVINVGTATLGGIIGAGGYGELIMRGIRTDDAGLILEGAIPAAVLALAVRSCLQLSDRVLVPRGLRLAPETGR